VDRVHNSIDWAWGGSPWTSGSGNAWSRRRAAETALRLVGPRHKELEGKGCEEPILVSLGNGRRWEGEVGDLRRNNDGQSPQEQRKGGELWSCCGEGRGGLGALYKSREWGAL
jgi:hypothetical protein